MNGQGSNVNRKFRFAFDPAYRRICWLFGITESRAVLTVNGRELTARFGRWLLSTTVDNVTSTSITGPFAYLKTAGPAHLSFADRGLTFATNGRTGVCLEFRKPVRGIDPFGLIRHPNLTVTVADTAGLVEILSAPHQ